MSNVSTVDFKTTQRRQRRVVRTNRRQQHAQQALASAQTPKQEAEATWNVLRAALMRLGHTDQAAVDEVYTDLATHLAAVHAQVQKLTRERKPW